MRLLAVVVVSALVACKAPAPAPVDAAPPAASPPVVESPAPPTASVSAAAPPAASVACKADVDCVAVPSPCCGARPSNKASIEAVRRAIQIEDGERCKTRLCVMQIHDAACRNGACVVVR